MTGLILAGGSGTRLYPLTEIAGKSLQPVADKPMVYYPLTTLIEAGIRKICVISTPHDLPRLKQLLGTGARFGVEFYYYEQKQPRGIAQAFIIAEKFIGDDSVTLILGDNIFHGWPSWTAIKKAKVFAYRVKEPSRYGVIEFETTTGLPFSIEEKPVNPKSKYAVPGLYMFDSGVVEIAHGQKPSARGELEITDIIRTYLERGELSVTELSRGFAWLDAGTSTSLHEASAYVYAIEQRTGVKIGCPEEAAWRAGFLTTDDLIKVTCDMPNCEYADYLKGLL